MEYCKRIRLKDGRECILRNGTEKDAASVLAVFKLTHEQTDWLLTYADENGFTEESEADFLREKTESENEIEIIADVGGVIAGMAGIELYGKQEKIRHRAEFGISVDRACWGLGIGRALTEACIECAKKAGYRQLELFVVADNSRAMQLYESVGFREYARNPRGHRLRSGEWQELVSMRLELD